MAQPQSASSPILSTGALEQVHRIAVKLKAGARVVVSMVDGSTVTITSPVTLPCQHPLDESTCLAMLKVVAPHFAPGCILCAHFGDGTSLQTRSLPKEDCNGGITSAPSHQPIPKSIQGARHQVPTTAVRSAANSSSSHTAACGSSHNRSSTPTAGQKCAQTAASSTTDQNATAALRPSRAVQAPSAAYTTLGEEVEVAIPSNLPPDRKFAFSYGGVKYVVQAPEDKKPGDKFRSRIRLPASSTQTKAPIPASSSGSSGTPNVTLHATAGQGHPPNHETHGVHSNAPSSDEGPYAVGDEVQIHGLRMREDLNGHRGRIVLYDSLSGRYHVELCNGQKPSAVKPTNLKRPQLPKPGMKPAIAKPPAQAQAQPSKDFSGAVPPLDEDMIEPLDESLPADLSEKESQEPRQASGSRADSETQTAKRRKL